jgi:hypothetical protein
VNLGTVNMARLESLAASAGITAEELHAELSARNLSGLSFSA